MSTWERQDGVVVGERGSWGSYRGFSGLRGMEVGRRSLDLGKQK